MSSDIFVYRSEQRAAALPSDCYVVCRYVIMETLKLQIFNVFLLFDLHLQELGDSKRFNKSVENLFLSLTTHIKSK